MEHVHFFLQDEAGAADIAAMIGCKNKHCKGPKTGCASCWKEAFARLEELPAEPAEPVAEQEVAVPEEEAKPVAPESVQPRRATRSSKRKADATQAEPPQAATTEAPAKAAGGDVKGSKRTRSAAKGETVAEPAQAEAPEGPPVKRQSSRLNKAAHPDAAPEPKPTSVARPKKGSKNAVAPEPQAAAGVGPAAEPGTQAPTAPPPPTAPSVPAEAEDIFQQIIQAEVTLQAGDALDLGMDPAAVLSPAPAPAPHPPLAEAESTPVPAAMEVTPVAVAPPASLLGKRSAPPTGRATMTKRGRLAGMLASKGRVRSLLRSGPLPSSHLPSKSPRCIEDVSSPAKPSPYAGDWDLPAEPAPEKPAPAKAPTDKAKGKKRRGAAAAPPSPQRSAGGGRADSSTGDAPEPTPLPRLGGLSPVMHDPALSDDEDAAVLNAAATGGLSPPGAPPALESPCKPTKQAKQVAAHASVLEASSEEHASGEAATPQSHLKAPKNQQHQQLRMSKLVPTAAQKKIEG